MEREKILNEIEHLEKEAWINRKKARLEWEEIEKYFWNLSLKELLSMIWYKKPLPRLNLLFVESYFEDKWKKIYYRNKEFGSMLTLENDLKNAKKDKLENDFINQVWLDYQTNQILNLSIKDVIYYWKYQEPLPEYTSRFIYNKLREPGEFERFQEKFPEYHFDPHIGLFGRRPPNASRCFACQRQ